jgi:hypothetical protein
MPLEEHDPTLAGLEAALATLAPMPGQINRDALLFRAGQASVPRRGWVWPSAAAALGIVAMTLGAMLALRPAAPPVERIYVYVKEPAAPTLAATETAPPPSESELSPGTIARHEPPMNYLQLQKQVMRWGVDGIPDTPETSPSLGQPLRREGLAGTPPEPMSFTSFFDLRSVFQ